MPRVVKCDHCDRPARLVDGSFIYGEQAREDIRDLKFWHCTPCDAYVGCHRGSTVPLGSLATGAMRTWRRAAHHAFDKLWKSGEHTRNDCYTWLAREMGIPFRKCHIGMFDITQCRKAIRICTARTSSTNQG